MDTTHLRNISIQPILLPLEKLLLNQAIDIALDAANLQGTSIAGGLDSLSDQLGMGDAFAGLEDAHDGGLRLVVAVGGDALVGFFVLGGGFLQLDGVDLDAVFRVGEGRVQREGVGR